MTYRLMLDQVAKVHQFTFGDFAFEFISYLLSLLNLGVIIFVPRKSGHSVATVPVADALLVSGSPIRFVSDILSEEPVCPWTFTVHRLFEAIVDSIFINGIVWTLVR